MKTETGRFERLVYKIITVNSYMYEPFMYGSVINTDSMVL